MHVSDSGGQSALAVVAAIVTALHQDVNKQGGNNEDRESKDNDRGTHATVARLCFPLRLCQLQHMHGLLLPSCYFQNTSKLPVPTKHEENEKGHNKGHEA